VIQNAKRARGRIARVSKAGQTMRIAVSIQPFEGLPVQYRFSTHFEFGELTLRAQRQRADGSRVLGDVLANRPVAACYGLNELSVTILRGHGKPVHLEFGDIAIFNSPEKFADPAIERQKLFLIQSIIQAQHRGAVRHFDEAFAGLAAHTLGWGVGGRQLRMQRLEFPQPANQRVIFGI
jgi:hypothetical protein